MVCSRPPSVKSRVLPTAQTSSAETAVTPVRKLFPFVVGKGFGLGTTLHEVPFQCSASVAFVTPTAPTAQASVGDFAATPRRSLRSEPTFGLASTDHLAPFQCSVSVRSTDPTTWNPTAHASVVESAETAFNSLFKFPLLGLLRARHVAPSKCSISVLKANDDGPRNLPTAHTSEAVFAETPESWLKSLLRFGVGWMVHVVPGFTPKEVADAATVPRTMAVKPPSPTVATRSRPIHLPIG